MIVPLYLICLTKRVAHLNALREKGVVVERIKKIALMSVGYIALFT